MGDWLKGVLFWDHDVWPQRKVWGRKVILYRDTVRALLSCVRWAELDWSTLQVPANHVYVHFGGMWAFVPVNGEDVFQVGCKECTGCWEWVSFVCCVYFYLHVCFELRSFLSSRSMGGILIEYCFLSSEVPWKAAETMWDGNYISCGQREKSQPHFHLLTLMTENQCNTYSKEFHSKNDCWYPRSAMYDKSRVISLVFVGICNVYMDRHWKLWLGHDDRLASHWLVLAFSYTASCQVKNNSN